MVKRKTDKKIFLIMAINSLLCSFMLSANAEGGYPGAPGGLDRRVVTNDSGYTTVAGHFTLHTTIPNGMRDQSAQSHLRHTPGDTEPTCYLGARADATQNDGRVEVDAGVASEKKAASPTGFAWDAFIRVTGGVNGDSVPYQAYVWNAQPNHLDPEKWYLIDDYNNSSIDTDLSFTIHADGSVSLTVGTITSGTNNAGNHITTFYWNGNEDHAGVDANTTFGPSVGLQVFTDKQRARARVKRNSGLNITAGNYLNHTGVVMTSTFSGGIVNGHDWGPDDVDQTLNYNPTGYDAPMDNAVHSGPDEAYDAWLNGHVHPGVSRTVVEFPNMDAPQDHPAMPPNERNYMARSNLDDSQIAKEGGKYRYMQETVRFNLRSNTGREARPIGHRRRQ